MRGQLGVLSIVLSAACASPTGDHEYGLAIREAGEPVATAATVRGELGSVEISGGFSIACAEGSTRGELQRPGARELVLIVHAEWPEVCAEGITYFTYDAIVHNLMAGSWHVQVLHTSNSANAPPNTVFSDFVTVQ